MEKDDAGSKVLSKRAVMKNDLNIRDKLKKINNIGLVIFFTIPLVLFLLGGITLAHWVALLWPLYSLGFIIYFRKTLRTISNESLQGTRMYSFYSLTWFVLIGSIIGIPYIICQVVK